MAKVKSIIDWDKIRLYGSLDSNLNGTNFNNTASQTVFSFGKFVVTSNLEGRSYIDYSNELSSFVRPVTLETMGLTDVQSEIIYNYATNAVLNLDKSDLNTFVRYGSAYEFLRIMIENIILNYPGSLFANAQSIFGGNYTVYDFDYDEVVDTSIFKIPNPTEYTVNKFGLIYNDGNLTEPDNKTLKNLNLSYDKYIVWSADNPTGNSYSIIGFTGNSNSANYLTIKTSGNPFPLVTGATAQINFHIKPNNKVFEEFRALLDDYQKYMLSERIVGATSGFKFIIKDPTLLENGTIIYSDAKLLWKTSDDYNIDIDTANYRNFLDSLLTIGNKYDAVKTDLIARFLTPASIKTYDLTEEGKMTKLLRLYGWEFDQMREFIDSLVHINKVTYDKINNIPDQLVKNLARAFGWNYFSLINEEELVESFLTIDDQERNLNTDLMPAEIDIELWRRILMNTSYFWKTKGTRESIKAMFLLIGIPEPFINITEYVYTVDGKIDPNTVTLTPLDFPTQSLPYDNDGYPIAPLEANNFYFQISGDTDSGQAYMDIFRSVGFNLTPIVDNKKSWLQAGEVTRVDDTTPQYYQEDSKLVLNTKEVDIALDTARGIEYDVFDYIKNTDFPANSSGYTLPYKFINISLGVSGSQNTFTLPVVESQLQGDWEVRFNGILLNAPKEFSGTTTGSTYVETGSTDYYITSGNTFILNGVYAQNIGNRRDVITATYIYTGATAPISGISIQYMVTRIKPNVATGTTIQLPSSASGDVQVTINGIALTKNSGIFTGDYTINPSNPSQIIISNPEVISYLAVMNQSTTNAYVQVAYVNVIGSTSIAARSEIYRIDSFSSGKVYYNSLAGKYVYKLNYKVNSVDEVKLLIDGIGLEPTKDYSINLMNPYEIFLPAGLKYGSIISAYYLVGGSDYFAPVIGDTFGVGDISTLSFLEFIELLQRRLINVRNRKTITDFKGGWYPTLLNVYIQYLQRANLEPTNPLLSNGYTFQNLYSFLSKYNAFFQKFVDQLLSATIILRRGGLLIRNTVFTKQKFTYKRGVNLYADGSTTTDIRGNAMIQYLGDDGSEFVIAQNPAPAPIVLHVDTIVGTSGTGGIGLGYVGSTGGIYISGYTTVTDYGMEYKCCSSGTWLCTPNPLCITPLVISQYPASICNLTEGSCYQYRAIVKAGVNVAYGDIYSTLIPVTPPEPIITPTALTCTGTMGSYSIINTGGIILPSGCGAGVDLYGMQYRAIGTVGEFGCLEISPTGLTFPHYDDIITCPTCNITICGQPTNVYTISKTFISGYTLNTGMTWVCEAPAAPPTPLGVSSAISVLPYYAPDENCTRVGKITYSAVTNCVDVYITQNAYQNPYNVISLITGGTQTGINCCSRTVERCGYWCFCDMPRPMGDSVRPMIRWAMCKPITTTAKKLCIVVYCNSIPIFTCSCCKTGAITWGGFTPVCGIFYDRDYDYNDMLSFKVYSQADSTQTSPSISKVCLDGLAVAYTVGCYCISSALSERCHAAVACKCIP